MPLSLSGVPFVAVAALGGLEVWSGSDATAAIEAVAVLVYLAWLVVEPRRASVREAALPDALQLPASSPDWLDDVCGNDRQRRRPSALAPD